MASLNPQAPEFIMFTSTTPSFPLYGTEPFFPYQTAYYFSYNSLIFTPTPTLETHHASTKIFTYYNPNLFSPYSYQELLPPPPPPAFNPLTFTYPDQQDLVVEKNVVVCEEIAPRSVVSSKDRRRFGRKSWKPSCLDGSVNLKKSFWKPKAVDDGDEKSKLVSVTHQKSEAKKKQFESDPIVLHNTRTTVMIRNIPNKINGEKMLEILDEHCYKVNMEGQWKYMEEEDDDDDDDDDHDGNFSSAYDFFYLPIDFETKCNKGYAFVNFTHPRAVWKFFNSLHNFKWEILNSKKVCEIMYARIQGKDALINHFQSSSFNCETDEYLPMHFTPSRDGFDKPVLQFTVGKRVNSLKLQTARGDDEEAKL